MEKEIHERVKRFFENKQNFTCQGDFVRRNYAFELPIEHGELTYYKLKYDFSFKTIPPDFSG